MKFMMSVVVICISVLDVINIPPVIQTYAPEQLCTSDIWSIGFSWF